MSPETGRSDALLLGLGLLRCVRGGCETGDEECVGGCVGVTDCDGETGGAELDTAGVLCVRVAPLGRSPALDEHPAAATTMQLSSRIRRT